MATLNIPTVELVSTLRAVAENGPLVSQDYNDSQAEALADLASLSGFINDFLIPMLDGLSAAIQPSQQNAPGPLEGRFIFSDSTDLSTLFFDQLSNAPNTIADSFRILQGIVNSTTAAIQNINVEITAIQTQLSSTNQNDIAQALQNFAASLQSLTEQTNANTSQLQATIVDFKTDSTTNPVQNILNLLSGNNILLTNLPSSGDVRFDSTFVTKTNGVLNSNQAKLDLTAGANVTLSEVGGVVTISATSGGSVLLQHNGTNNTSQTTLNLQNGNGITITNPSGGNITIAGVTLQTGGSNNSTQTLLNLAAGQSISVVELLGTVTIAVTSIPESVLSISNNTTANVSTSAHGFAPILPNDSTKFLDGTGVYSAQYVVAGYLDGVFGISQIVIAYPVDRSVNFAGNFSGSQATLQTAATAAMDFSVQKNGTQIGTIHFAISGTVATFTTTGGSPQSFVAADVLSIIAPASPDATAAGLGFSLAGTR